MEEKKMVEMTEERKNEFCRMIIRFYNMQEGCSLRLDSKSNLNSTYYCLERVDYDIDHVKQYIKKWLSDHKESYDSPTEKFLACIQTCSKVKEAPVEMPFGEERKPAPANDEVSSSLGILEKAVVELIAKTQADKIESEIMGNVEKTVRDFIKDEYGTIERKITTVVDGKKAEMQGIQHEKFETVLKFVSNNEPVFLTGPAGSGKNVICKQIAEALGLKFYFTNAVTQEYKLTGFTDAMGNYQPTQFYEAFTKGGVFMLDEMDASIPEVLVILNAAIANRYFDFPAPIGYVEAHEDFRVIAAGNTVGQGASSQYVGRTQLDGASLDRFALVEIDYSESIENTVADGDVELADFCRAYRKSAIKSGQQIIVSYRAIGRLAKMIKIMDLEEALKTCLVKGTEKDDLNIIVNGISKESKYKDALKNVVNRMTA